jgi:hypothetical protein
MKLKYTEVKQYRTEQLTQQNQCCALCGEQIYDDAVLDHDHKTGLIRKVLHRGCNALLGKIENNMARNHVDHHRLEMIASNIAAYISTQWTDLRHPTHKNQEERKLAAKKRRKAKKSVNITAIKTAMDK